MALKYFRDNLKSLTWVLWGVIAVMFIFVFYEFGGAGGGDGPVRGDDVAAVVGDEVISMKDFEAQYRRQENEYRQLFGDQFNRELVQQFLPKQALDTLINRKIMLREAENVGLRATNGEVQDLILSSPLFKDDDGKFVGQEEYVKLVRAYFRSTPEQFEETVRDDVVLQKLDSVLAKTLFISDSDLERSYRDEAEKATIRFVQLPASEFSDVVADDAAVTAYFEEHQDEYTLPEQRVANYLLVDTVKLRQKLDDEITDEDILAYYNDHEDEFTSPEQVKARHILIKVTPDRDETAAEQVANDIKGRIEGGKDFAQLARDLSEDEGSARRGGDLNFFGRDQMVKPFEDAAFGAQVGELVGPVKSDFGYHVIEVQDRRAGGLQPVDQVRPRVRAKLMTEEVKTMAEAKAQEMSERIKSEGLTTEEQLQALADGEDVVTFGTTDPFGENDPITGLGRSPDFNAAAFELGKGNISDPIKVPRGWSVIQLKDVVEPRVPDISEVKQRVQDAANQEQRQVAALARLEELRAAPETASIDALATELGLEIQESGEFDRFGRITGLGANREIIDGALALEAGQLGTPVKTAQGAVLYEVVERKSFDAAEFEAEIETIRRREETKQLNELKQSLVELRWRDLTPAYGKQVLERFNIQPADSAG